MLRMERQNEHHVPQSCINLLSISCAAVVTIDRYRFLVTILVVNVDGREPLAEPLDLHAYV